MIGKVNIRGHIGPSYVDESGKFHKGVVLLDIIDQILSQPLAKSFEVDIDSPGGYVDIGDDIYNYLVDVDKTRPVSTIQKGLVGSIATKIFLSGSTRLVDDRYEFWIHNPFRENVTGDADTLRAEADSTEKTEKEIRKFYGSFTPMGDVAIDALMKQETGLTADQCIKYGFATGKVKVPVFNLINTKNTMKPEEKGLKEQLLALLGVKPEVKKGVAPKAQVPANEAKSLVVNLADGAGSFWIEGEAVAEGLGAFLLDAEGQPTMEPLADGDYPLEDGSMVSVSGGKVSAVKPKEEEAALPQMVSKEEAEAMVQAAVEKALAGNKAEFEKVEAKFNGEILALKKGVTLGVQPKAGFLSNKDKKLEYKSIGERMAEKAAERKQQLKKN